jgi:hypothetical protein
MDASPSLSFEAPTEKLAAHLKAKETGGSVTDDGDKQDGAQFELL